MNRHMEEARESDIITFEGKHREQMRALARLMEKIRKGGRE